MRNQKFIVTAIVALGLCFSVGAATGVKISAELKNQAMKVNGTSTSKEVISYNNTTYVPLRQIGEMLDAKIDYKDGTVIVETENTNIDIDAECIEKFMETIGQDWCIVKDDEEAYFYNMELEARLDAFSFEIEEYETIKEWFKDLGNTEYLKIKSANLEKLNGMDIAYIEGVFDGENFVEVDLIEDNTFYAYSMVYDNNDNPASLKEALLKFVAADWQ